MLCIFTLFLLGNIGCNTEEASNDPYSQCIMVHGYSNNVACKANPNTDPGKISCELINDQSAEHAWRTASECKIVLSQIHDQWKLEEEANRQLWRELCLEGSKYGNGCTPPVPSAPILPGQDSRRTHVCIGTGTRRIGVAVCRLKIKRILKKTRILFSDP